MAKPKLSKPKLKKKSGAAPASGADKARGLVDSAQQIWMAGLGAFGRAQEEGTKLFESLVKEGASLEQMTRRFATGRVDSARDAVETTVAQVKERAADTWDKLEKVFEERVSRALGRLGVPGRDEMEALLERVEELNRAVRKLNEQSGKSAPARKQPTVKTGARKAQAAVAMAVEAAGDVQAAAAGAVKKAVRKARKAVS
jgi:poly(hydroxyalkanoate) granule-associated protein